MILKRYLSVVRPLCRTVLTFPGQGQVVDKAFVQGLHDEYNLTSFKKSLEDKLSPEFATNVFSPSPQFYQKTSNTQPSIVSLSLLILDILERHHGIKLLDQGIDNVMGHSLGEFTALAVNDVFQHNKDAQLWLVRQRGLLMEQALSHSRDQYKMTALLFPAMNFEDVERLLSGAIKEVGTVGIANINNPQQIVISGESTAVDSVIEMIKERSNIKRKLKSIPLQVRTPFHNPLLETSKLKFRAIVEKKFNIEGSKLLKVPIISNLTGEEVVTHGKALDNFIDGFINPVQFKKSIEYVIEKSRDDVHFINIGPNAFVNQASIAKTDANKEVNTNITIGTVDEIKLFVESYEAMNK